MRHYNHFYFLVAYNWLTILQLIGLSVKHIGKILGLLSLAAICSLSMSLSAAFLYLNPQIPEVRSFTDVTLKAPLGVYSADNKLIEEFGERLTPISYDEIPPLFRHALLNTEDKRFFEHSGIDLITLMNATWQLVRNMGEIHSGASTITMQLVKNVSGDNQELFFRKFKEMLLAVKVEQELSKKEILTLYLNVIDFGKHAVGIQAAANTYYGKNIDELTLAQMAMLAGIPKKPQKGNPINGPEWALQRRNLVLSRMLEQGSVNQQQYDEALKAPITASVHNRVIELPAPYVAEMVRKHLRMTYGDQVYSQGIKVYTTLDSRHQQIAENAILDQLIAYDRRHGYRGPEYRQLQGIDEYIAAPEYGYPPNWLETLENLTPVADQYPGIVTLVEDTHIEVLTQEGEAVPMSFETMSWARPYISVNQRGPRPKTPHDVVSVGDVIRFVPTTEGIALGQIPDIQGALVSMDPDSGAIRALVGGLDFKLRQFNHVTQARRQPGSLLKPLVYAGAIDSGMTAASVYNNAPLVLPGGEQEEVYRPKNSGDSFSSELRLRDALVRSVNLVSMRVVLDYGATNVVRYLSRFGFDTEEFPLDVQLAFGGGTIALSPLEVAAAYATFANGGYRIEPYLIAYIENLDGEEMFRDAGPRICKDEICDIDNPALRIMEPRVAHIMDSILNDVVRRGTGRRAAREMKRDDLRGKTGTTNDADVWFSGYTPDLVTTVWSGFGDNTPVGEQEWGSRLPLDAWIDYMSEALPPESEGDDLEIPDGLVTIRINPDTGDRALPNEPYIREIFRQEYAPPALTDFSESKGGSSQTIDIF